MAPEERLTTRARSAGVYSLLGLAAMWSNTAVSSAPLPSLGRPVVLLTVVLAGAAVAVPLALAVRFPGAVERLLLGARVVRVMRAGALAAPAFLLVVREAIASSVALGRAAFSAAAG